MRDSWNTLLGALAALLVLYFLLYTPENQTPVSRPTSADHEDNGYAGLYFWLQDAGVRALSQRNNYHHLQSLPTLSADGNVLLTTLPHTNPLRSSEYRAVRGWVKQGNTLLVLAALNDTPFWVLQAEGEELVEELEGLTGIAFEVLSNTDGEPVQAGKLFDETRLSMSPLANHPLTEGVSEIRSISDSITNLWEPAYWYFGSSALRLAADVEYGVPTLWEIPMGQGRVILFTSGSVFANRLLDKADNAQFIVNLLAWHLGQNGTFIFDDFHQGLSELYDADDFFADKRLHNTLWFILAFWLIYLVGTSARLVKPREHITHSHQADLVQATGGFMSRKLSQREAGKAMIATWLEELRRGGLLLARQEEHIPWNDILLLYQNTPEVLREVQKQHAQLGRGEKISLRALHNNLLTLKRSRV